MIAIILAAGDSIYWKWDTRKHIFSLGKEKIIERLQRQLEDRKINYVVVTDDIDVMAISKNVFAPPSFNGTIDTLEASKEKWKDHDRVVVLLGDTIYSKKSLNKIIDFTGNHRFFGKEFEILAISTNCASEIHKLPTEARDLRGYYDYTNSSPIYILDDYTTDINTDEQYMNFIRTVVNAGKLDDTKND